MSAHLPLSTPPRYDSPERPANCAPQAERAAAEPVAAADQAGLFREERRSHARISASMPVHVVTAEGVSHCIADNLSAGGALLSGAPSMEPGSELVVALRLRGHPWHVRARVLRVQRDAAGHNVLAVAFPGIMPKVQDLIQSYVLSRLRQGGRIS